MKLRLGYRTWLWVSLSIMVGALSLIGPAGQRAGGQAPQVWTREVLFTLQYGDELGQLGVHIVPEPEPGEEAEGESSGPSGLAVDGSGNIYIYDLINGEIKKFSPQGTLLRHFGLAGGVSGLYACPDDALFVAYGADPNPGVRPGEYLAKFSADGQFLWHKPLEEVIPPSVAPHGAFPNRVGEAPQGWGMCWEYQPDWDGRGTPSFHLSDADGNYVGTLPGPPTSRGYIDVPGSLYYEDPPGTWHRTIHFVNAQGQTVSHVELEGAPDVPAQDTCADITARIYVSATYDEPELFGPAILAYGQAGALLQEVRLTWPNWATNLTSELVTADGSIYGFEWHADSVDIVKYSPSGE